MKHVATQTQVKAFEKFQAELRAFGEQTGETFVTLYEDAYTTRRVANFRLYLNGKLTWVEFDEGRGLSRAEEYRHTDPEDVADSLRFWRANLRRARRYWAMDVETLDKIQDGEMDDPEE